MADIVLIIEGKVQKEIDKDDLENVFIMMFNFAKFFGRFFTRGSQIVKELVDNQAIDLYMKFVKFPLLCLLEGSKTFTYFW